MHVDELSPEQLRYLTEVDGRDHVAWAALDEERPGLPGVLAGTARDNGITTFRNYVLADNEAMIELLDELGAELVPEEEGVHRLDLPIPEVPDDVPDTLVGRTLRAAAAGRLRMLVSAITPVRLPTSAVPLGDRGDGVGSPLLEAWADETFGQGVEHPGNDDA